MEQRILQVKMTDRLRWQTLFSLLLSQLYLFCQWIFSFSESHCALQCQENALRKLCYPGKGKILKLVLREEKLEYLDLVDSWIWVWKRWRESLDCLTVACHIGDGDHFKSVAQVFPAIKAKSPDTLRIVMVRSCSYAPSKVSWWLFQSNTTS